MSKTTFTVKRKDLKIVMERTFRAPPERVFKTITDRESIPNWWGPKRFETIIDKLDVRKGGTWRYINRDAEGKEYAFHGVFKEVDSPRRLSYTFNYEGISGNHETVETAKFEKVGVKTKMTATVQYKSLEDLDGTVNTDMEEGAIETWERLAELVEA